MTYSLKRIFHNIRRRMGVYLIFLLEFAIGIAVLSSTMNVLFSLRKDLAEAQAQMAQNKLDIVCRHAGKSLTQTASEEWVTPWEEEIDVSYELYRELNRIYGGDLEISYALAGISNWEGVYYENKDNLVEGYSYTIYFVNNAKFREFFDTDIEPGKIYAGEEAYAYLNRYIGYHKDPKYIYASYDDAKGFPLPISVKDGKLFLSQEKECELVPNPPTDRKFFIDDPDSPDDMKPKLSEAVFVPVEDFPAYRALVRREFNPYNIKYELVSLDDSSVIRKISRPCPFYNSHLSLRYKSAEADVNIVPSVLSFLNNSTDSGEFSMSQELLEIQLLADSVSQAVIMQIIQAIAVMLIVVLGTTGLFLIFLYQRKKQMAVSIAYGSTKARLFGEIFAEIFLITGLGTVLGLFTLKFTMEDAVELYSATTLQPAAIIIPIAAALLCSLLTASMAFSGVGEISPAKILKEI